jgi:hypothetical protein
LRTVLERLARHQQDPENSIGAALCATCVDVAEVAGAGLTIHTAPGEGHLSIASSDPVMFELEELERTLGEGPCVDAFRTGLTVAEPDLVNPAASRWVAFTAEAVRAGARAAFGYPLQIAAARFGALNLYAAEPGSLTEDQHENTLVVAGLATHVIASSQLDGPIDVLVDEFSDVSTNQLEIHQAAGMTSVQLGVSIAEALVRLRGHAFAEGLPLSAVAVEVVGRRLRLEP